MNPVLECSLGRITGKLKKVRDVRVEAFLGLPYAKPPIGKLRFAFAEPSAKLGFFNASGYGPACTQPAILPDETPSPQSEDCLFVNIFRKQGTQKDDKKAVIVIIHGGAFCIGSGSDMYYNGAPLAALGDVVAVSINYRLGILGFADFMGLAPANLGLHDQRLALQWIQKNISEFGGNPDNVTLLGVSAGAMCVSALMMSPLLRDERLFHGAIMDAGVLSSAVTESSEASFERIKGIAKFLGCESEGPELVDFLRQVHSRVLVDLSYDVNGHSPIFTFLPTADGVFNSKDITEDFKNNSDKFIKVKTMIGYSKDEGTMFSSYYFDGRSFPDLKNEREFLDWCAKLTQGYHVPVDMEDSELRENIIDTYYKKHPRVFNATSQFIGDGLFAAPMNKFIKEYAKCNKDVYVYHFERLMKGTYLDMNPKIVGAYHFAPYLHFSGAFLGEVCTISVNSEDEKYFRDCIEMISNFAKGTGPPVFRGLEWPDYSTDGKIMVFKKKPEVATAIPRDEEMAKIFSVYK